MNRSTFTRRDVRLTIAVLAVIAVCGLYVRMEYSKAFPQASLNLRLSRAEITARAATFLQSRSLPPAGFRELTVFDPDEDARLYLEREVGLERANELMSGSVAVWRWRARWFRPPQKEERVVWLNPEGRVIGFEHIVEEGAGGARLDHGRAMELARGFVTQFAASPGRLVEDRLEQRPNRYDYLFTWEQEGFRAKDATYRRTVVVAGDQVGKYQEFLYIPESWRRDFAGLRSRNETLAGIASACWLPLVIAALVLLVQGLRQRRIPWRPLLWMAGVVGGLQIISNWNAIPLLIDSFPTSSPYPQTVLLILLQSLGAGVGVFFYVIIAAAAGEPLYRERLQDRLSLKSAFTLRGAATSRFYRGVMAGYAFASVHLAFLVAFYLIGRRFGAWSPQDVQYSDLLSTALPWIYPIAIAAMASTAEEFWFRLLAIPLLERLLRFRWIAIIIPAFVWGFLHANYPQQPAWIRGVEVGLIGVGAGVLMYRFGIVATLTWHYAIDALLIGLNLFDSSAWSYRVSAAILMVAIAAPLIVSLALYRRNRGFVEMEEEDAVVTAPTAVVESAPAVEEPVPAVPLWDVRILYGVAAVTLVAAVMFGARIYGDWIRVRITRAQAEAIARAQVPDAGRWRTTTDFVANLDPVEFEYLRRVAGPDAAERAVRERKPTAVWRTRFFRPLEKQEWRVYVDQSGGVVRKDHLLDERAPGARLSQDEARARAIPAVPSAYTQLVEGSEEKRDQRTDHTFVFEDPKFRVGDARARASIEIHGDEPASLRRFIRLPEEWLRDFGKPTPRDFVLPALIGSLILPLLVVFIRRLGAHETLFHSRTYSLLAAGGLVCAAAGAVNDLATVMSGYDTAMPEQNYLTQYFVGRATLILLATVGVFAAVMALDLFRQAAVGRARLNRPLFARSVAVAVLLGGFAGFTAWLRGLAPGPWRTVPVWSIGGLDSWIPAVDALTGAYLQAVLAVSLGGIGVFAAARYLNVRGRVAWLVVLIAAAAYGRSLTVAGFAVNALIMAAWIGVLFLVIRTCGTDLTGYGIAVFWVLVFAAVRQYVRQPAPAVMWNGIGAIVVGLVAGWAAIRWLGRLPARRTEF